MFVTGHSGLLITYGIDGLLPMWRVRPSAELQMDTLQLPFFCCVDSTGTFLDLCNISRTVHIYRVHTHTLFSISSLICLSHIHVGILERTITAIDDEHERKQCYKCELGRYNYRT